MGRAGPGPCGGRGLTRVRLLAATVSRHSLGAPENLSHRQGIIPDQARPLMGGRAVSLGVISRRISQYVWADETVTRIVVQGAVWPTPHEEQRGRLPNRAYLVTPSVPASLTAPQYACTKSLLPGRA